MNFKNHKILFYDSLPGLFDVGTLSEEESLHKQLINVKQIMYDTRLVTSVLPLILSILEEGVPYTLVKITLS